MISIVPWLILSQRHRWPHSVDNVPVKAPLTVITLVVVGVGGWTFAHVDAAGQSANTQVPIFEYDPTFPKPLPETWAIGPIGGLAVDRRDHLYVVQRPGPLRTNERFSGADDTPPKADCCIPAPPVLEFDEAGT